MWIFISTGTTGFVSDPAQYRYRTGSIYHSSTGDSWTAINFGGITPFASAINGIAWNGTMWVYVGATENNGTLFTNNPNPTAAYSQDGLTWTKATTDFSMYTNSYFTSLAWNGTKWVAAFNTGTIIAYSFDGADWYFESVSFNSIYIASRVVLPYVGTNNGMTGATGIAGLTGATGPAGSGSCQRVATCRVLLK